MVLQTERYPGGYNQNSYSSYQGPNGSYSNYQGVTEQTTPYSGYPQMSTHSSTHAQQQHSGWSTGGDYHGNGASNYIGAGYGSHPVKPSTGGYGNSHYGNSHNHGSPHGQGHGSPHSHGHGSPQGYGNSHGYGNSNGYGSGPTNMFSKPSHGQSGYGHSSQNYGHTPSGTNQPSWILKGLDDDE